MKQTVTVIIIGVLIILSGDINAQIKKTNCDDFDNYRVMQKDTENRKMKEFDIPIRAYGATDAMAKYNVKIEVLKNLTGYQTYLNNPMVDSIFAEFAGELIIFLKDEFNVFRTKKRDKATLGEYTCMVDKVAYNPDLIEFLQYHINNFLKYSAIFTINPYIMKYGDENTRELYDKARNKFHTAFLDGKWKFDNVIDHRLLEPGELLPKPTNYTPCDNGYIVYETDSKYLNYILELKNNENNSRQLDIVFSIDTITIMDIKNTKDKVVTFHVIAYNVNTATEILVYDSKITVEAGSPYDAVDLAIQTIFERDIPIYMYQVTKRYSSYIRDGMLFTLKICDECLDDDIIDEIDLALIECKLFADASIFPGEWKIRGKGIGKIYEGRSYLLDRLKLRINLKRLLKECGVENFDLDLSGTNFIITPKKEK